MKPFEWGNLMEPLFDVNTLIWLFPIIFILHDFEEIIMLERWIVSKREEIYKRLPTKIANRIIKQFSMTTAQMSVAVLVIFLFVSSAAFMASQYINNGPMANIDFFTVMILIFFIHVFTHIGQSLFFRSITPGVVTSVILVLPYCLVTLKALLANQIIDWNSIVISLPFVLLILPVVFAAHWIGKKIV